MCKIFIIVISFFLPLAAWGIGWSPDNLAPVVQRVDSTIQRDSVVCFANTYPLDSVIHPLNNRGLVFSSSMVKFIDKEQVEQTLHFRHHSGLQRRFPTKPEGP